MTVLMHGGHCIKTSSTTQIPISLSTGESEYHGGVRSASAPLGLRSLARDFGVEHRGARLFFDATAAEGIASRGGVGKIKHLRAEVLWLQQSVTTRQVSVHKVNTDYNPADVGTKHLLASRIWHLLSLIGLCRRAGRSSLALQASTSTSSTM